MTVNEFRTLIKSGANSWDVADAVINATYPEWPHVQNRAILRGNIANVVYALTVKEEIIKIKEDKP